MGEHEKPASGGFMSGGVYDALKFCALILFPAAATAYFSLAGIWGLPAAEQVVGTIVVVDTFLGVILQISKTQYDKSDASVDGVVKTIGDGEDTRVTGLSLSQLESKDLTPGQKLTVKVQPLRPNADPPA